MPIQAATTPALLAHAIEALWTTFEIEGEPLSPPELERLILRPGFFVFAALTDDGQTVGAASVQVVLTSDQRTEEALIWDLAVLPAYQRQGYGRALIDHIVQWARSQGYCSTFVLAEAEDTEAVAFYRRSALSREMAVRLFAHD